MAIKKAQANLDNGSSYDILHYETQVSQVKVMDASGSQTSDLNEMLFDGKLLSGVNLNTVKTSGKYRVKGGSNLPSGSVSTNTYIMNVDAVDIGSGVVVVHQEFYDHVNHEIHHRTINGSTIGAWVRIGKTVADQVAKIGNLANLYTLQKGTIVDAINSLSAEVQDITNTQQVNIKSDIAKLDNKLTTHNHDNRYLSLTGGSLTGALAVANGKSLAGKNTSGASLNIGVINGTNEVVLGDSTAKTIINAKSGDISLSDGSNSYKIFHSGNDGSGSGMDADTVDGLQGSQIARRDVNNTLKGDQTISEGKSLYLKAIEGQSNAGSIHFRDGSNTQKGRILVDSNGTMNLYGGTIKGFAIKSNGDVETNYDINLNAKDRQVRVRFMLDDKDEGAGLYMNKTSKQVGMYDWNLHDWYFTTNRDTREVQFDKNIKIQGRRLSIQTSAPSGPSTGDVWIDI